MNTDNTVPIDIWCYGCESTTTGSINAETSELECNACHGTFVEMVGQGVENFLGNAISSSENNQSLTNQPLTAPVSTSRVSIISASGPNEGNIVIQRILDRVLGMGVQVGPREQTSLLDVIQNIAEDSTQPVEIVVRQPLTVEDSTALTSLVGDQTEEQRQQQERSRQARRSPAPTRRMPARRPSITDLLEALIGVPRLIAQSESSELENILHHILMHEQSQRGVPAASESIIANLDRKVVQESEVEELGECNITFEKFSPGDVCVTLKCGHKYFESQIVHWLGMHATCPVCRINLNEEPTSS